jgi:hypothetical protein
MEAISSVVEVLAASTEPSVRFLLNTGVLGQAESAVENRVLLEQIRSSARIQVMLSHWQGLHPYQKWNGAHWVLYLLADLGYPVGDDALIPLREAELAWLLDESRLKKIPYIDGRYRRCASQEGNAVYSLTKLGLADDRISSLVDWLLRWQWPDGGWNCDKNLEAHVSSFNETLIPLRGLIAYHQAAHESNLKPIIDRAAEVFLTRHLYRRVHDNRILFGSFVKLHHPNYWHYDILFGLRVMMEGGYLGDPRCKEALDLLESKQQEGCGFPAEEKYYRFTEEVSTGTSALDWGPVSKHKINEFVTVEALTVLKHAGRI